MVLYIYSIMVLYIYIEWEYNDDGKKTGEQGNKG